MGPLTSNDRISHDRLSTRGYMNLMRDVLRHSHQAREIAVFTDWRMWVITTDALEYAGFTIRAMIVWIKPSHGIGRPWRNAHELIAFGMRGASSRDRIAQEANWIQCNRSGNYHHPTEKPVELVRRILANMDTGVVVDPFMGSGTTLRAAKDLGREAIGVDVDASYCAATVERLGQMTLEVGA
jgi:site-specific DNA-methyltransferase (adenine-specific)